MPVDYITYLHDEITGFYDIRSYKPIVEWASANIDFSEDVSAERDRLDFSLTPHLIEPLQAWEFDGVIRRVQVIGIQQHGKTLLEVIGATYSMEQKPCSMLCVYPSDDLAKDINETKYEPIIGKIPVLARELDRPFSKRTDRYKFSNSTMFFQGAGRKIMSKSCKIAIADEVDEWPEIGIDNFSDLEKRTRSYSESITYSVTSPKEADSPGWKNFLSGSQGYWTLRCCGCGKHTMRSCDIDNLQFETTYDEENRVYIVDPESIRLICPHCGFEHVESRKFEMNRAGKYVHRYADRVRLRPSFQFGVLCSLFPWGTWLRIAEERLKSGRTSTRKEQMDFDNSLRGLPFMPRSVSKQEEESIKKHFFPSPPPAEEIEAVFIISDTQDTFFPTGVFAFDVNDNMYLLEYHTLEYLYLEEEERKRINVRRKQDNQPEIITAEDLRCKEFFGIAPLLYMIDKKGHRTAEIERFAKRASTILMYAGTNLRAERFRLSEKRSKTLLVSAREYQADLIYYLYSQKDKSCKYFFITPDLSPETIAEITCVQPDKTKKSGHIPNNWTPANDAVHDAFDVLKMFLVAKDYAIKKFRRDRFRRGEAESIRRRWAPLDESAPKKKPPVKKSSGRGWFSN